MKIGVSAIGYECKEYLPEVLAPWLSSQVNAQVFISAAHGVFPETAKLGFPVESTDLSHEELRRLYHEGIIHNFKMAEEPVFENDLRNMTLAYLFDQNIDLLWLLDLQDEIYTVNEINNIIKYVAENPENDWLKINFKTYVFDHHTYIDDFIAPRIWQPGRSGGIRGFYFDNDVIYNNGATQDDVPNGVVPRNIAFVKHLSWVGSPHYLKRKINFQNLHYEECSYKWNEEQGCLQFNFEYYSKYDMKPPTLYFDN